MWTIFFLFVQLFCRSRTSIWHFRIHLSSMIKRCWLVKCCSSSSCLGLENPLIEDFHASSSTVSFKGTMRSNWNRSFKIKSSVKNCGTNQKVSGGRLALDTYINMLESTLSLMYREAVYLMLRSGRRADRTIAGGPLGSQSGCSDIWNDFIFSWRHVQSIEHLSLKYFKPVELYPLI